jgi:enoyl-[acyl-carrier protein] reductase II
VRPPRRRQDLARLRELTDRPFAVNHTRRPFSEEVFAASLEAPPAVVSLALGESGGFSGAVSTLALVPQVVDAVRPIPVVASGGIADGRGLAAALVLGAEHGYMPFRAPSHPPGSSLRCGLPQ